MVFSITSLTSTAQGLIESGIRKADTGGILSVFDARLSNKERVRESSSDPTTKIDDVASSTTIYKFPHDVPKYYISFAFREYSRPSQFKGLNVQGLTDYITLPMPSSLNDHNEIGYSSNTSSFLIESLSPSVNRAIDLTKKDGLSGFVNSLGGSFSAGSEAAVGSSLRSLEGIGGSAANILTGDPLFASGALQVAGLADNMFPSVYLTGPDFKSHRFVWLLSANSKEESTTIKNIVKAFKKAAYPELLTAGAGGFYKYPLLVVPKFNPVEVEEYLYRFKPCVITNVSMSYAPRDKPAFYAGTSAPVTVVLQLALKEIELWRNGTDKELSNGNIPTIADGDFNDISQPPVRNLGEVKG